MWKKASIIVMAGMCLFATGCNPNQAQDNQMGQQAAQDNRGAPARQDVRGDDRQANADNRIQVADRAARKIAQMKGIDQANVLVTQRNAYVAAVLDDNRRPLDRKFEDQIAKQVRAADPNIRNVYVSTNPDFVDRVNEYVNDVQKGRPVAGFFEEFNEMIIRMFPKAR
ncbi:YhcN/YlaJ family sporulation lipoprotein [Paenibacillus alkalitolerans]|uniref:YhcN/YlaJ family sporulation lipoprotein n=1 Tax=Paenibacillus alkalitolerans TaxID=2799335 RepID=UPI0018F5DFC5|nr:YhcN/YlaJ family sporulation lipoprotein [Paenibacillus alkalitolerans]